MKTRINPYRFLVGAFIAGSSLSANPLYWNPAPLSDDWDNTVWAETSGGTPTVTWSSGATAIFDQAGTYTVTLSTAQTADLLSIAAGDVTLSGSLLTSNSINIAAAASLTGAGDTLLKVGTTTLTVDGTWALSSSATSTSARVSLAGGSGAIIANGNLRTNGNFNFAGDISGSGGILTDAAGSFTLGGNNTYSGNSLFRHGNTIRLDSSNAISPNSWLRFGGGTNIVQLAAADFSRTLGTAAGQVRFHAGADGAGNSGFAAIDADRNVAINGTVLWGGGSFNPGIFYLGTSASTHTVTLTTDIDLNAGTRIISTANGSSTAGGRVSGSLTNGTLQVQGTGTLILSGNNTLATINKGASGSDTGTLILSGSNAFSDTTLNFGTNSQNRGAIRLENDNALGGITDINGNYTGTAIAQIQLANDVTISGINYALGGRSNAATAGAALVNVSGDNIWAGTLRIANTGGAYGIRSDAGTLTISGELRNGLGTTRTWELTGNGNIDITGDIVNGSAFALALLKTGSGVLTITGDSNTYTGGTTVNDGTLFANNTSGSATGTGSVVIGDGTGDPASAILGGTGTIGGAITVAADGAIAPGTSVGNLSALGNVSGTGSLEIEIDGATADSLTLQGGALDISGLTLDISELAAPAAPVYVIVNADSAINGGMFAAVTGLPAGYSVAYNHNDGVDTHNIALVAAAGSPFTNWATVTNGLAGNDALPEADPDDDGFSNLMEFVLGGQPNPANPGSNSSGLAPIVETDENNLIFTFRRTALSATQPGMIVAAEYGSSLTGWTTAADGVNGITIVPTEDHYGDGIDRIVVTIPKTLAVGDAMFARLRAFIP